MVRWSDTLQQNTGGYVVVQFYPWFIFLCFKVITIHYHTLKQREIKFKPTKGKTEPQHIICGLNLSLQCRLDQNFLCLLLIFGAKKLFLNGCIQVYHEKGFYLEQYSCWTQVTIYGYSVLILKSCPSCILYYIYMVISYAKKGREGWLLFSDIQDKQGCH